MSDVGALLTGCSLPLLLVKLAFIPGGVGVVEATMFAMFTMFTSLGTGGAATSVAVLGYRLLSFWIPTLIGFALVPPFQRQAAEEPHDVVASES